MKLARLFLLIVVVLTFYCCAGAGRRAEAGRAAAGQLLSRYPPHLAGPLPGMSSAGQGPGRACVTSYAALKKGGESMQPGVVPGNADESELLSQILPSGNEPPAMPKGSAALKPDQVELVRHGLPKGRKTTRPRPPKSRSIAIIRRSMRRRQC